MTRTDSRSVPARTAEPRRTAAAGEPRWSTLWRELARARERLAEHERRAGAVETLFRTGIEPRERLLTLGVVRVTGALVEHYEVTALERADRSVLGLWINENLESLAGHPYAPTLPVEALVTRWRALLDAAGDAPPDPADPASAGYRTMPVKLDGAARETAERDAISRYLGALFERGANVRAHERRSAAFRSDFAANASRGDARGAGAAPSGADPEAADAPSSGAGPGCRPGPGAGPRSPGGDAPARDGLGAADGARELLERLFRRLARALHPDREPDAERRELKHVLMSTALAARRAGDLDTLLSLHAEHVGDLPEALDGTDADALVGALERQLEGMRRALDRARGGDPFRAELLARYDGADDAARARRVARHAERLDAETVRLERLVASLRDADGLADALDDRREIERDRLAVDELTGC